MCYLGQCTRLILISIRRFHSWIPIHRPCDGDASAYCQSPCRRCRLQGKVRQCLGEVQGAGQVPPHPVPVLTLLRLHQHHLYSHSVNAHS